MTQMLLIFADFCKQLTAHRSSLTTQRCLEDANINSRGLSSLRFYCIYIKKASGRRGTVMGIANPRLMSSTLQMRRNGGTIISNCSHLIAHYSPLKGRLEDAKPVRANSRGFLNPWKKRGEREMASVKTRNGNDFERLTFNDER